MFKLTRAMASSPDDCEQLPSNAAMPVPIVPIVTPNNPESHPVTHLPTMPVATIEVPNIDTKEPPTVSHSELHSFSLSVSILEQRALMCSPCRHLILPQELSKPQS